MGKGSQEPFRIRILIFLDHPARIRPRPLPRLAFLLPLFAALLLVGGTGLLVHLYRLSVTGDRTIQPTFPRAGRPFRIVIPPTAANPRTTLRLVVTKEVGAPYAPGIWPAPGVVMRFALAPSPESRSVFLGLQDPGLYRIRITDSATGSSLFSRTIRVVVPASFLGNTLLLLAALSLAGAGSGALARKQLAFPSRTGRFMMVALLLDLSALFIFGSLAERPAKAPVTLPVKKGITSRMEGILSIREQVRQGGIGEWDTIGDDRLLFRGPIIWGGGETAPIVSLQEAGRLRATLVRPRQRGAGLQILREVVRTGTEKPGLEKRNLGLFLGFFFFSGIFFAGSLPISRRPSGKKS